MYRPSQTPRLAVSSNRITRERISAPVTTHHNVARNVRANGRTKQHGREVRNATLRAWLKNTVTVAARERTTHAFRLTDGARRGVAIHVILRSLPTLRPDTVAQHELLQPTIANS
ncbi:hypothetical protein TcasGA2_TC034496 [Tribolium castaneum]|uniref:Uncharacterized protein n=1 Tax=Tribolium castaneum TaxID=7070 RepID=A0A139W9A1_TRICA|nr:hypothetical protein TcasGA2_TC034496 [Tribolium castaneum]